MVSKYHANPRKKPKIHRWFRRFTTSTNVTCNAFPYSTNHDGCVSTQDQWSVRKSHLNKIIMSTETLILHVVCYTLYAYSIVVVVRYIHTWNKWIKMCSSLENHKRRHTEFLIVTTFLGVSVLVILVGVTLLSLNLLKELL